MSAHPYEYSKIEKKWQTFWAENKTFRAHDDFSKPKFYALIEFPYPSAAGLHVGHPKPYIAMDIISRLKRLQGFNVLLPMGWDAFGLPTENYAIKNKIHPAIVTQNNIKRFREQLDVIGFSFDWDRVVDTTDPKYYKWTQWIFLKLLEHGLAYKTEMPINWCTSCKVGLANEEVVGGVCERCGSEVVRKTKSQWMLRITAYAQKLLDGLDDVDFIEKVKVQQRNWIGRSEGAELDFCLENLDYKLRVYTTRPDTLFGATYMVISPEHALVDTYADKIQNIDEVRAYRQEAAKKSDFERTEINKEKTGVELKGIRAINPVTGKPIPVWIADYVLTSYGTGAIMAVPGHDERDHAFAKKFNLPIVQVVSGGEVDVQEEAYSDIEHGTMVNSGFLDGLSVEDAKKAIVDFLEEKKIGEKKVNFKLRDWVFSRQRYWGEPIPVIWCKDCGCVPLKEDQLPLMLPQTDSYMPTDTGESPLSAMDEWVNVPCPVCGKPAKRETDTMPQWAGSSWYFLRYIDPNNDQMLADPEKLKYWMPVDWYNGGMEHTTLHLLYSRFWNNFLYDIGVVPYAEPYKKRTSQGMVLGDNGEKMSKSRGNVVNPDDVIAEIGADALRLYEMFMGAFDQAIPWSTNGAKGCKRFLDRVWGLMDMIKGDGYSKDLMPETHETIKKVTDDYEKMKFNTGIAQMMSYVNLLYKRGFVTKGELKTLLVLLYPVAPHTAEEMWQLIGEKGFIHEQSWPSFDEAKIVRDEVEIAIQVNGKIRGRLMVASSLTKEDAQATLMEKEELKAAIGDKELVKFVYVPGRLVNIVVK